MNDREALKRRIDGLSPMGVRFVIRMVDSLSNPPHATLRTPEPTWITAQPDWIEYFGLMIAAHHGVTVQALGLANFENAFQRACEAVGWTVWQSGSATHRFTDLVVETPDSRQRKLSLKSTAAHRLSKTSLHISKLTEAAWIQDVRSARTRRHKTLELFDQYCSAVDAIIMLRAFRSDPDALPNRYQLVEVPCAIFAALTTTPITAFEADGPTVDCAYNDDPAAARVLLDRSDAKITVKQVKLTACHIHAEWELTQDRS